MVFFPHAKINLGLQVIKKRHDGFHNIISCLYPIQWCDVLEILEKPKLSLTTTGLEIPGNPQDNLCLKAYHLVKELNDIPPVHIHLHKAVPIGAGLGGGSSDAAFTLKGLQQKFDLPLSSQELKQLASQLGGDCAFFIDGTPALATGVGNQLERIDLSLPKGGHLVVVTPPLQVNTGKAYALLTPKDPATDLKQALKADLSQWPKLITNDFEGPVFEQFPQIARIKETLLAKGAIYASLSGSGSSVYGIFEEEQECREWFGPDFRVWQEAL